MKQKNAARSTGTRALTRVPPGRTSYLSRSLFAGSSQLSHHSSRGPFSPRNPPLGMLRRHRPRNSTNCFLAQSARRQPAHRRNRMVFQPLMRPLLLQCPLGARRRKTRPSVAPVARTPAAPPPCAPPDHRTTRPRFPYCSPTGHGCCSRTWRAAFRSHGASVLL